jgi:hypothetical protein
MQNKPNFLETQMNINPVKAKCYEQKPPLRPPVKQTQFKPNQTQFQSSFTSLDPYIQKPDGNFITA